ncbi:TPA: hypothetical protein U2C79_000633 [Streptococcus suis]|nr:hypothetical protein [Streptococcus suis]
MHIEHHAKANGITYAESKSRFNEKLLEFINKKGYNVGIDISGYALLHLESMPGLSMTNEVMSESTSLALLKSNYRAKAIMDFLEMENW